MELVGLGVIGFWVLLGIAFVLIGALALNERSIAAGVTIVVTLFILQFLSGFKPFTLIAHNPWWAVPVLLGGYLFLGAVWCCFKWRLFADGIVEEIQEMKRSFLLNHGVEGGVIPDELILYWADDLDRFMRNRGYKGDSVWDGGKAWVPQVSDHKGRLVHWICYWPWSALWFLLNNPLARLGRAVYHAIKGALQRIADHSFKKVSADLPDADRLRKAREAKNARLAKEGARADSDECG